MYLQELFKEGLFNIFNNDRIEQASGPDYEALDSAEIETKVLFSAVVAMDDTLPSY